MRGLLLALSFAAVVGAISVVIAQTGERGVRSVDKFASSGSAEVSEATSPCDGVAQSGCSPLPTALSSGYDEELWCVREGNPTTLEGCDHVVERIEDVPEGAVWAPTHGGLEDPEEIRRYWCADTPPSFPRWTSGECDKYFPEGHPGWP